MIKPFINYVKKRCLHMPTELISLFFKKRVEILLATILTVTVPCATAYGVRMALEAELKPFKLSVASIVKDVGDVKKLLHDQVLEEAVAAYSKVFTLEQLRQNPGNRVAIKRGLADNTTRLVLTGIDRARTIKFIDYFSCEFQGQEFAAKVNGYSHVAAKNKFKEDEGDTKVAMATPSD